MPVPHRCLRSIAGERRAVSLTVLARQELRRNLGSVGAVVTLLTGYSLSNDRRVSIPCAIPVHSSTVVLTDGSIEVTEYNNLSTGVVDKVVKYKLFCLVSSRPAAVPYKSPINTFRPVQLIPRGHVQTVLPCPLPWDATYKTARDRTGYRLTTSITHRTFNI